MKQLKAMKTLLKLPLLLLVLMLIISSCDKIASPKYDAKKLVKIQEKLENINDFSDDEYYIVLEDYVEIVEKHLKSREKWEKFKNEMKKYDELGNVNTDYDNMRSTVETIKTFILKENNKKDDKVLEATID